MTTQILESWWSQGDPGARRTIVCIWDCNPVRGPSEGREDEQAGSMISDVQSAEMCRNRSRSTCSVDLSGQVCGVNMFCGNFKHIWPHSRQHEYLAFQEQCGDVWSVESALFVPFSSFSGRFTCLTEPLH